MNTGHERGPDHDGVIEHSHHDTGRRVVAWSWLASIAVHGQAPRLPIVTWRQCVH
jgi:hypothetical protein